MGYWGDSYFTSVQINITIEADGDMFVDRQPIKLDQLKGKLTELIKPESDSLVIINADEMLLFVSS